MKTALTIWRNRISPVFDAAQQVLIVQIENGIVIDRAYETLGPEWPYSRASKLSKLAVRVVICGAISLEFRRMLEIYGIRVIPFINGETNRVLEAYIRGTLFESTYNMLGYGRGRRTRFRGGSR